MEIIQQLKNYTFGPNTAYDYLIAVVVFIGLIIALKIFQVIILARLKELAEKTKTDFDDALIAIFKKVKPPFYFVIALYFGLKILVTPAILSGAVKVLFIVIIAYEIIRALERFLDYFVDKYLSRVKEGQNAVKSESMAKTVKLILKVLLWILGILAVLSNLGVNVTSIIASLGIGGLAVALALQNILKDLFSSFSIYVDRPFEEGDFIIVGSDMGTVEKIGLKSTRIKTLQGEQLIVANTELTDARVQNFKKMEKRRVVFSLGVVYGTRQEKLASIPKIIKEIIDQTELAEPDRCHFIEYGDFSLNFETVYYVQSPDYNIHMDVKQKINLAIAKKFEQEKIDFAFPTQTIFMGKEQA